MVEFKAFKGGVFVLNKRYENKEDAKVEQKKFNRMGIQSSLLPETDKRGKKVYALWVKD